MSKSKINIDGKVLDKISVSTHLSNSEKINFLKYVGYLTISERQELISVI